MRFLRNLVLLSLLANWSAQAVNIIAIEYDLEAQALKATIEYLGMEDEEQEFSVVVKPNAEGDLVGTIVEVQDEIEGAVNNSPAHLKASPAKKKLSKQEARKLNKSREHERRELVKAKKEAEALEAAKKNITKEIIIPFVRRDAPVLFHIQDLPLPLEVVPADGDSEEGVVVEAFGNNGEDDDLEAPTEQAPARPVIYGIRNGATQGSASSW